MHELAQARRGHWSLKRRLTNVTRPLVLVMDLDLQQTFHARCTSRKLYVHIGP
jgi:hypothetical protein